MHCRCVQCMRGVCSKLADRTLTQGGNKCCRTWKRNSVAGSGGPTVPVCRLGGGCVKNDAAHLLQQANPRLSITMRPAANHGRQSR